MFIMSACDVQPSPLRSVPCRPSPYETSFPISSSLLFTTPSVPSIMAARQRRGSMEVVDAKFAVDLATAQNYYVENVFFFVPNLIGEST